MAENSIAIRLIEAHEAFHLRHSVLRPGRPEEHSQYPSDQLPETFHLGLYDNDRGPLAVASFTPRQLEDHGGAQDHPYILVGMAVDKEEQGRGLGRLLLEQGFNELHSRGCGFVWCKARKVAVPFYRRLGFQGHGDWYDTELSGLHLVMYREL